MFIGKKEKNTPVSATEAALPLPAKKETNMLKRGQDDDAKYLSKHSNCIFRDNLYFGRPHNLSSF